MPCGNVSKPGNGPSLIHAKTKYGVMKTSFGKQWPLFFHAFGPNRIAVGKGHLVGVAHLMPIRESKAVLHGTQNGRIDVDLILICLERLTSCPLGCGAQFMIHLDLAIL